MSGDGDPSASTEMEQLVISEQSKVRRNPQVVARELAEGEGGVLLHLESGQYHGLNPIGVAIWDSLEEVRTVEQVVDSLRARVSDPPAHLAADVLGFLASMRERDLIMVE